MTHKEKMILLMDDLLKVVHRIANDENAAREDIALLPQLAQSIAYITSYAAV